MPSTGHEEVPATTEAGDHVSEDHLDAVQAARRISEAGNRGLDFDEVCRALGRDPATFR